MITDIPTYSSFAKIEPITKGWSGDEKYYIETQSGEKLLLRISDIAEIDRKRGEFSMLQRADSLGIEMSHPIEFGFCDGGNKIYSLMSWCEGKDVDEVLPNLPESERYSIGIKSGELLKKLHSLPAPDDAEPWGERFRRKIKGRLEFITEHGLNPNGLSTIIRYIEENQTILDGRPQCFNHGDYNTTNLIITPDNQIGVIDFNYYNADYGDPWWEFCTVIWGQEADTHFYTGLINGYFGTLPRGILPPNEFFNVLAFYFAYDALAALCESLEIDITNAYHVAEKHVLNILKWFDDMKNPVPIWYMGNLSII